MGRLVQQPPPARTYRERASSRGGSALLCPARGTGLSRLTQAKPPPRNPARFTLLSLALVAQDRARRDVGSEIEQDRKMAAVARLAAGQVESKGLAVEV